MSKIRVGNKKNAILNGDWGKHGDKPKAASKRRQEDKIEVRKRLDNE